MHELRFEFSFADIMKNISQYHSTVGAVRANLSLRPALQFAPLNAAPCLDVMSLAFFEVAAVSLQAFDLRRVHTCRSVTTGDV